MSGFLIFLTSAKVIPSRNVVIVAVVVVVINIVDNDTDAVKHRLNGT